MRFRHRDGTLVHVCYGTNVHPAEDLAGVIGQIETYGEPVAEALGAGRLGLGLWLARDVATQLASDPAAVKGLRGELDRRGLEVVTLNGFPYRGFHDPVVKLAVYQPDWSSLRPVHRRPGRHPGPPAARRRRLGERLHPSAGLARALAARPGGGGQAADQLARRRAGPGASRNRQARPRRLRAGTWLRGGEHRAGRGPAGRAGSGLVRGVPGHLPSRGGVRAARRGPGRAGRAGLPVVKLQASCALQVDDPASAAARDTLARFDEPRFLHQTREALPRRSRIRTWRTRTEWTTSAPRWRAACQDPARGGCTSTSRCTRRPRRRCGPPATC